MNQCNYFGTQLELFPKAKHSYTLEYILESVARGMYKNVHSNTIHKQKPNKPRNNVAGDQQESGEVHGGMSIQGILHISQNR